MSLKSKRFGSKSAIFGTSFRVIFFLYSVFLVSSSFAQRNPPVSVPKINNVNVFTTEGNESILIWNPSPIDQFQSEKQKRPIKNLTSVYLFGDDIPNELLGQLAKLKAIHLFFVESSSFDFEKLKIVLSGNTRFEKIELRCPKLNPENTFCCFIGENVRNLVLLTERIGEFSDNLDKCLNKAFEEKKCFPFVLLSSRMELKHEKLFCGISDKNLSIYRRWDQIQNGFLTDKGIKVSDWVGASNLKKVHQPTIKISLKFLGEPSLLRENDVNSISFDKSISGLQAGTAQRKGIFVSDKEIPLNASVSFEYFGVQYVIKDEKGSGIVSFSYKVKDGKVVRTVQTASRKTVEIEVHRNCNVEVNSPNGRVNGVVGGRIGSVKFHSPWYFENTDEYEAKAIVIKGARK